MTYKTYWSTWLVLLALTVMMILVGFVSIPKGLILTVLICAMFVKAGLIGGNFMHLRYETAALVVVVALGILFTAAALFFGIAPDGVRALTLSSPE